MAHIHDVHDDDKHFSIVPSTRALESHVDGKLYVMQYDHNSERITFDLPTVVEGHSILDCDKIEVHYLNIDARTRKQKDGLYEVDDLQLSPDSNDVATCSWLISGNATQLVGPLYFRITLKCVTDGIIDYSWSTKIFKRLAVSSGINTTEFIAEEYADILSKWEARITALEQGGASIELDTTLTQSGKAADAKAVGDALAEKQPKGDYLTQNELQSATNAALAQAKESGEFDGADGITPSIGNNGNWYIGKTDTGKPSRGEKGDPGDTPDMTAYRTAEAQDVIDAGKQGTLIQSGATVGQIAKITAVDSNGKPTSWQAVDMPSVGGGEVWRYLGKFETSEEVSSIVVSEDADGNPFALKKVIVSGLIAANSAGFSGWIKMYDQNGTVVLDVPSAVAQNDGGTVVGRGFQCESWIIAGTYHQRTRLESINIGSAAYLLTVISGANGAFTGVDKNAAPEAITKLTGKSYGSTPWGAGSYLYVWGVDA